MPLHNKKEPRGKWPGRDKEARTEGALCFNKTTINPGNPAVMLVEFDPMFRHRTHGMASPGAGR